LNRHDIERYACPSYFVAAAKPQIIHFHALATQSRQAPSSSPGT
jgi:hypothetical protein